MNDLDKGKLFEEDVKELLVLKGLDVEDEKRIGNKKVDLYFEEKNFNRVKKIAVECKFYQRNLGVSIVKKIVQDYSVLVSNRLLDEVVIVSKSNFSVASKEYLDYCKNIFYVTYDELLNSVIDFSKYKSYLKDQFLNSPDGISNYFIYLNAKPNTLPYELRPSKSFYNHENELKFNKNAEYERRIETDLFNIIQNWISKSDNTPLAILGSYGQGKTSFAKFLAYQLSLNKSEDSRIPILIRLSKISREQSIEGLIAIELANNNLVKNYNFHSFIRLNKLGKFTIILDGFDEMKHSLTWEEFQYNFTQINSLISINSKVIILGRPNAFITDAEYRLALRGERSTNLGIIKDVNWPQYHEIEIDLLKTDQIKSFLKRYYNYLAENTTDEKSKRKYQHTLTFKTEKLGNKKIREISSRPVQLKMLADILPETNINVEKLTTTSLYQEFTQQILNREIIKQSKFNIGKSERQKFTQLIATYLWENSNEYSIKNEDIPDFIFTKIYNATGNNLNKLKRDLISGCFLSRKFGESIYFPHKSFQEYFVAEHIVDSLKPSDEFVGFDWLNKYLTDEVYYFVSELMGKVDVGLLEKKVIFHKGQLSYRVLKILYLFSSNETLSEKIQNSRSPWLLILYTQNITHKRGQDWFKKLLLNSLQPENEVAFSCLVLFLSLNDYLNSSLDVITKIINLIKNHLYTISKKNITIDSKISALINLINKLEFSPKKSIVDYRGAIPIIFGHLREYAFITEWNKNQFLIANNFKSNFQIKVNDREKIKQIQLQIMEISQMNIT
ncbi:restriction endonuclease [Winogradskyella sp.]|uniref:restriction endonuclease n=1 Tax=Winogradskyella sp. TaxID=1883156 RepID=UPI00260E3123|nr:restriction endonuclease [Winogradskyella sp.]